MTKDEALKMAIEALEFIKDGGFYTGEDDCIQACKEALLVPTNTEQPAQEPVSLGDFDNMTKAECVDYIEYLRKEIDLLRFKEWQGLSDDEISLMAWNKCSEDWNDLNYRKCWLEGYKAGAKDSEQALKDKNT